VSISPDRCLWARGDRFGQPAHCAARSGRLLGLSGTCPLPKHTTRCSSLGLLCARYTVPGDSLSSRSFVRRVSKRHGGLDHLGDFVVSHIRRHPLRVVPGHCTLRLPSSTQRKTRDKQRLRDGHSCVAAQQLRLVERNRASRSARSEWNCVSMGFLFVFAPLFVPRLTLHTAGNI
jgi:hypothetical protein